MSNEFVTVVRFLVMILSVFIILAFWRQLYILRGQIGGDLIIKGWSVILFAFSVGYGSLEAWLNEVPGGPRILFALLACVWAIISIVLPAKYQHFPEVAKIHFPKKKKNADADPS